MSETMDLEETFILDSQIQSPRVQDETLREALNNRFNSSEHDTTQLEV